MDQYIQMIEKENNAGPLDDLINSGFCSGCGICAGLLGSSKVQMRLSQQGYLRPLTLKALDAEDAELVQTVCPGIRIEHDSSPCNYHPIWGPIIRVRTGQATDEHICREGSSGGVLSALAVYLLESQQVDFVAQISVVTGDPLLNKVQMSRTRADVLRAAGSRYAPAAPLDRLEEFLLTGQRFAVIGKPCDIAAVRNLGRIDPRVNRQIPFLLSFMCAGVPSINGTHELLHALEIDSSRLKSFRYRGDGWPGMTRAVGVDGQVAEMSYSKSWGSILNRHLQFRCKICPDGTGEFADVVCADAWYGKDGYPDFNEKEGRSLVVSRTNVGESLVKEATRAGVIRVSDLAIPQIDHMQPYQLHRKKVLLGRLLGLYLHRGRLPYFRRMGLIKASLSANPLDWFRNVIGIYKRAIGEKP
jgi:coenzyme F420 hydrogenase subunit beta